MKCRACKTQAKFLYQTNPLPEYIWPTNLKVKRSICKVYECKKCKVLQLQNFSSTKIKSFYGDESFVIVNKKKHHQRLSTIKKFYGKNFFKKKNTLDIGGGVNSVFNNKKADILDFIISKEVKNNHKGKLFIKDINEEFLNKKYDLFFLFHTLEHLKYPVKTLLNIKKMMKPKSKLFIEIPNFDYFINKRPHYAIFHQHLNMYCVKSFKNTLSLAGLKIEKTFLKKEVIFCSIIINQTHNKIININNEKKIKILKFKKKIVQKKLKKFVGDKKINLYGAGGNALLFFANYNFLMKKIKLVFDIDKKKINKNFLGIKIIKKEKNLLLNNNYSISSYKLIKKNNFLIL